MKNGRPGPLGPRNGQPLEQWEVRLIAACKAERRQLREEIVQIRSAHPTAYYVAGTPQNERRKEIYRGLRELTDAKLAEKFETTKWQIEKIAER